VYPIVLLLQMFTDYSSNAALDTRYEKLEKMSEAGYGRVYKAKDKESGEIVALKKMRMPLGNDEDGIHYTTLREIAALKKIQHPNIVGLLDVALGESRLYLIYEFCDADLKRYMNNIRGLLSAQLVKELMYQMVMGITYCHMHHLLHRDLKPQNILVKKGVLKLAGFALARALPIPMRTLTHEVVTLWYRAPEILLGCKHYSVGVDMWSIGCIFAELVTKQPLFPSDSEIDQLYRIFRVCGTPTEAMWPGVSQLPDWKPTLPYWNPKAMGSIVPGLDEQGVDLLAQMLTYDPKRRISGKDALHHPYFADLDPSWKAKFQADC